MPMLYLLTLGIVIQYAILFKTKGVDLDFDLSSQLLAIFAAVITAVFLAFFRQATWRKGAMQVLTVAIGLLGLALVLNQGDGTNRWIEIGGWQIQPTEIAKLAVIAVLAGILAAYNDQANRFRVILLTLIVAGLPLALTAVQPDLGSALVFVAIWSGMVLVSRIRLTRIALIGLVFLSGLVISVPFLAEYQQNRLVSYFNPNFDTQGVNYNTVQASIAIGSGGLSGRGLDSGTQSQLNFLPAQHTDFVFAVIAEKLGLIGAGSVILALGMIIMRLTFLAWKTIDPFKKQILVGIASFLFFHSFVNIGMNLGVLPVTGLPLPLLSYGGTFMFICLLAILIAVIISSRMIKEERR